MKHITAVLLCCIYFTTYCNAQNSFTIEQGQNIAHSIPVNEVYLFTKFTNGAVYYKDGRAGGGALNYNYLTQELVFIDAKGDTLPVEGAEETDSILIGNSRLYYYKDGFVKLDTVTRETKLGTRNVFSAADRKVVGYNGISSSSTSNLDYAQFKLNPGTTIFANEQIVLSKNRLLCIGNRMNHFMDVNKKNLFKFYGKKQNALKKYLDENNFSSANRDDVIKLMLYMEKQ
jgi:hypothetical protein